MKRIILFITVLSIVSAFGLSDLLRLKHSEAAKLGLPEPNKLLKSSKDFSSPVLMGIRLDKDNPLNIDFIVDCADKNSISKAESKKLISYFLSALTVASEDYWVNLSPYEENRIIADSLSKTELGKELLAQDYILKQLSSSLTHPKTDLGREYWANPVGAQYLDADSNFNKVWIVPGDIEIYEDGNAAYVTKSSLDLMSEVDYLAGKVNMNDEDNSLDVILPELKDEVNNGKHFSSLRQLYRSMILAVWFKAKFKESFYRHYINKNKISNLELEDKTVKERIYKLYCDAFKQGVYSVVQSTNGVKRNYFCGGVNAEGINKKITFSSSVNSVGDVSSMGPVKIIKTALRAGFAVGENDKVEPRKEQPRDKVDIQGIESKANANNNDKRVKEIYNPYAKKQVPDQKGSNVDILSSGVELIPLDGYEPERYANDDQWGAYSMKEIEKAQAKKVTFDLRTMLSNAAKINKHVQAVFANYNQGKGLESAKLLEALSYFAEINGAVLKRNNSLYDKSAGIAFSGSIVFFAASVQSLVVKMMHTGRSRAYETKGTYTPENDIGQSLEDIANAYEGLELKANEYIFTHGSKLSSSAVVQGGVDFVEMELKTSSSSIPVEINGIDFEKFNGFSFSILAIDSEEDIV